MSRIIKGQVNVDRSVYTKFSKKEGFFTMYADVWSVVQELHDGCKGGILMYSHDITDICINFTIDGKSVQRKGFEELYVKLYGDGAFAKLLMDFENEVETEYYKTTEYTPINNK